MIALTKSIARSKSQHSLSITSNKSLAISVPGKSPMYNRATACTVDVYMVI